MNTTAFLIAGSVFGLKIRLHRQVRAELRQVGELECGFGSSLADPLIVLCFDERTAVMCSGNCYSKLSPITPGNQRGESEHATGVVDEPVHAGVADAELTE